MVPLTYHGQGGVSVRMGINSPLLHLLEVEYGVTLHITSEEFSRLPHSPSSH